MSLLVQKFGGTSVGSVERIEAVADLIIAHRQAGHKVVAVVSAMSGETNRLIQLAKQFDDKPNLREMDALITTGEQVSCALLAMALIQRGHPAQSFTAEQAGIYTDNKFGKARIQHIDRKILDEVLELGRIPVIAGFQGRDREGNITSLGRGGSDTTAVAIAAAITADECQIYTDVDGVYTTDPRVEPKAHRLSHITFDEMLEMAGLGAKVLQIRSVEFAGHHRVPLRVLSSFNPDNGTLISFEENEVNKPVVSGIAFNRDEARITVVKATNDISLPARILSPLGEAGIEIDMIVQNINQDNKVDFSFTVHRQDFSEAMAILKAQQESLQAELIDGVSNVVKLSAVGVGMKSHAGVAATLFKVLAQENIPIELISTSEIKISVLIPEKYLELGVRALHEAFCTN